MQTISPLTAADFRAKVKCGLAKFEIYDGSAWVDLTAFGSPAKNYLVKDSLQVAPSGPCATPDIKGGTWSCQIFNPQGMFHPFHPTSAYKDYFRIGREVRISLGARIGGTDYYYQRLIGYMNQPRLVGKGRIVELSGDDYTKLLADFTLRESSATTGTINGPLHWGAVETLPSVASPGGIGSEIYAENDAMEIGAGEANNVTNWLVLSGSGSFDAMATGPTSSYYGRFTRELAGPAGEYAHNSNVGSVVAGNSYRVSFRARATIADSGYGYLTIYETSGGSAVQLASLSFAGPTWYSYSTIVEVSTSGALQLRFGCAGKYITAGDTFDIDDISIELVSGDTWMRYDLDPACNGPYFVTLDGEVIEREQGVTSDREKGGWHYIEDAKQLYFSTAMTIDAGLTIKVYEYRSEAPENMVADILVAAGYYVDRATALAAMDYTATGVTIPRPFFEEGISGLKAVAQICQRVNYRFWFGYDGTPCFKPAPTAGNPAFDFEGIGDVQCLDDTQDLEQIRNRVVITGSDQAMFQTTADKKENRWTAEASDATSISTYKEHTEEVKNDLFQDQASATALAAAILAERKDPRWYTTVPVGYQAVPLEMGDTIRWRALLYRPTGTLDMGAGWAAGGATFDFGDDWAAETGGTLDFGDAWAGAVEITMTGIVRGISISGLQVTYTVEVSAWE